MIKNISKIIVVAVLLFGITTFATYTGMRIHTREMAEQTKTTQADHAGKEAASLKETQNIIAKFRIRVRRKCVEAFNSMGSGVSSWRLYDMECYMPNIEDYYYSKSILHFYSENDRLRCRCRASVDNSTILIETHIWVAR